LDTGLVVLSLPLVLLLMAGIALAIRAEGTGPILFRQTRVGLGGRPFTMLKFRSMVPGAEAMKPSLLAQSEREGPCFKSRNDPRITRIGAILRRTSLDELPQLFNVLWGQMSLVGPRPALPSEVAEWPPHAHARHTVLPGLTGPWQVGGRAEVSFDEMIRMDLGYARNVRIASDLRILLQTVRTVINGRGAW
jgi:lipopolysaccharide/colanic/teichoic acid biosynthesis glycosyltransferase